MKTKSNLCIRIVKLQIGCTKNEVKKQKKLFLISLSHDFVKKQNQIKSIQFLQIEKKSSQKSLSQQSQDNITAIRSMTEQKLCKDQEVTPPPLY